MKFYEGTTTLTQERITSNDLQFPQIMICSQLGYKTDVVTEMGLPKDILNTLEPHHFDGNNHDFDAQSVWDNVTYSANDFAINWVYVQGRLLSLCTVYNSKMALLHPIT